MNLKNLIVKEMNLILLESSLSRVRQHIMDHDCAIITAFRNNPRDITNCVDPDEFRDSYMSQEGLSIRDINKLRNRDLKAILLKSGYGITSVEGSYIEDFGLPSAVEVSEDSYFVVNLSDNPEFLNKLIGLGKKYCQDSILFIPRGGNGARLIGTNNGSFPGYEQEIEVGDLNMGREAEFMTRIGKRPMIFKEQLETYKNHGLTARMAITAIARRHATTG